MDYSKTSFKLIPITPNTKKPRDKGWQEDIYRGTDFTKKKDNERLEVKLKEIGWNKTQFYREITTKWLDGKVIIQVSQKHTLSI
jgi:hypothetical protein